MNLLTILEAAKELRVSKTFLLRLIHNGSLKHVKLGRRILIRRNDLETFVASNVQSAA